MGNFILSSDLHGMVRGWSADDVAACAATG
jgi:hypothetical protein